MPVIRHPLRHRYFRTMDVATDNCCYHCGETLLTTRIVAHDKCFCCEGCRLVYEILEENDLCTYYQLNEQPGVSWRLPVRADKFACLDDARLQQQLIQYRDDTHTHVNFYVPHIHCSSCIWLLESLHRLDAGVERVQVNFVRKEVRIVFRQGETTLRKVAETMTSIGYEPYLSLQDLQQKAPRVDRRLIYQIGVAGFCFGNVMLLSFPEYFSSPGDIDPILFRYLNLLLALPVFLYSAQAFYRSAWGGLKHGFLNIDVPIVLAIVVTFTRSLIDILTGAGPGYFDAMTGIVFFMLAGRILQEKTYKGLSFDRDYKSYFPIAVTVIEDKKEKAVPLPEIKAGQTLLIHNNELVPADGILVKGKALIDYSFVTGESAPVERSAGEIIYAGGRQTEGNIELLTIKEVAQSYLTGLWNRQELREEEEKKSVSFVHLLARNFTWVVLMIAAMTAVWWGVYDAANIWPAVTAILIVACPCALLLASSFTNAHMLRLLGKHRFYLRDAGAIERMAEADAIVFDKTGTLTDKRTGVTISHRGLLTWEEREALGSLVAQSTHPLSEALAGYCGTFRQPVKDFRNVEGQGISGSVNGLAMKLGNATFTGALHEETARGSAVYLSVNGKIKGHFSVHQSYREGIDTLLRQLRERYQLALLSGDNDREAPVLRRLMGPGAELRFRQQPGDKLDYVLQLQQEGRKVMMIGDGLNDAGALKQSDIGISVTDDTNNFTPASDAILDGRQLLLLPYFIRLCRANKRIIMISFVYSLTYNITGLFFAVQAKLSPVIAAILMPASSISIILLTWCMSWRAAAKLRKADKDHRKD